MENNLSKTDKRVDALLQEQDQYREEVRMFDSHLFRVILSYVTALVAAFGWLGTQIIQRAASFAPSGNGMLEPQAFGQATSFVLTGLARGPFFYLFASLPVISFLMFLYFARDWASLNERFHLLIQVGDDIAKAVDAGGNTNLFRLDRGPKTNRGVLRSATEIVLVSVWSLTVLFASVTIVLRLHPYAVGVGKTIWWWFGCAGMFSTLSIAVVALVVFLTRRYGRAHNHDRIAKPAPPGKPIHTDSASSD
jgi:hypothetical protein